MLIAKCSISNLPEALDEDTEVKQGDLIVAVQVAGNQEEILNYRHLRRRRCYQISANQIGGSHHDAHVVLHIGYERQSEEASAIQDELQRHGDGMTVDL